MENNDSSINEKEKDVIIYNPKTKNLTNTSQSVIRKNLTPYWDKEYILENINKISNSQDKMLIRFLWMSGVRITEAISITKKDIDLKNYMMRVRWLKSRKYKERILPIHPRLKDILELYIAPLNLDDKVFPFTRQRAWQITQKYLQGNPHKLRHSFAVNWLRSGGDIIVLHRILGHAKVQTTMEYLKIVPIDQGKELLKISFD